MRAVVGRRGTGSRGPCHRYRGDPGRMSLRLVSWVSRHPRLASNVWAACHSLRRGSRRVELGRRAGCSMHRDALGDRGSNRCCVVAVVGRNRRDSCLLRRGCSLPSTMLCVSLLDASNYSPAVKASSHFVTASLHTQTHVHLAAKVTGRQKLLPGWGPSESPECPVAGWVTHSGLLVGNLGEAVPERAYAQAVVVDPFRTGLRYHLGGLYDSQFDAGWIGSQKVSGGGRRQLRRLQGVHGALLSTTPKRVCCLLLT